MSLKPTMDKFEDNIPCAPDVEQHIRERAVAQFFEDAGDDWFAGADDCNAIMLRQYLEALDRPVTRRNLMIAWKELNEGGFLEKPFDPDYKLIPQPDKPGQARRYKGTEHNVKKILSTIVTRHQPLNTAEIQLIGERPERMEEIGSQKLRAFAAERQRLNELSPIGQPVTPALKTAYRQSLAEEHNKQQKPRRVAESRAVVSLNWPSVKRDSAEFNRLVNAELAKIGQ